MMEIYRQDDNVWAIISKDGKDRILVYLYEGELEFYKGADVIDLVGPIKKRPEE